MPPIWPHRGRYYELSGDNDTCLDLGQFVHAKAVHHLRYRPDNGRVFGGKAFAVIIYNRQRTALIIVAIGFVGFFLQIKFKAFEVVNGLDQLIALYLPAVQFLHQF